MADSVYDIFESYECPKCSGRGHIYGFSHVAGGVCFQCGGPGKRFTRKGQKDYDRWRAAVDAVTVRPASEMKEGDFVKLGTDWRKYYQIEGLSIGPEDCGRAVKGPDGEFLKNPDGSMLFTRDVGYVVRMNKDIILSGPLGRYSQRTFWVGYGSDVRIHPGVDKMPKAEEFDYRRKVKA